MQYLTNKTMTKTANNMIKLIGYLAPKALYVKQCKYKKKEKADCTGKMINAKIEIIPCAISNHFTYPASRNKIVNIKQNTIVLFEKNCFNFCPINSRVIT